MLYPAYLLFLASASAVLLPDPAGPFSVGVAVATLTDETRLDPFAPDDIPQKRRVVTSTFIPLNTTLTPCISRSTPYMTPLVAGDYDILAASAGLPNTTFTSLAMQLCDIPKRKPCSRTHNARPLLMFSPGFGQSRFLYSAMARSLASEGYIVVTVDHPYDATVVEFTDGSFVRAANISTDDDGVMEKVIQVRASDISFVIDQLQNATALRQPIENSGSRIDLDRILMYGHSLGGAASAATMLSDARIRGGVDLDGRFFSPEEERGVDRPFLTVGRPDHRAEDPTWDVFYGNVRAPIAEIAVAGNVHGSFTDYPTIITSLDLNLTGDARASLQEFVGSGDWARMGDITKSLVVAFGDFVFEHTVPKILRGADADFPEVSVVRSKQL